MCTVTFFPKSTGFILTHNRDEAPSRSPKEITRAEKLLFPRDVKAGGTWVAASQNGTVACLLNGAFAKHKHQPPYRKSRGLMLLDFFENPTPEIFFEKYDFAGIEPFTLLVFSAKAANEIRWDGQQKFLKKLPADQPRFWCSATLYPPEMQQKREAVFMDWLAQKNNPEAKDLKSLHLKGKVGDPENDFVMNRGGRVRTVSVTQIVFKNNALRLSYHDLLEGQRNAKSMKALG